MTELQSENGFFGDQSGAESGSQAEEEHPTSFVSSKRRHRGVVHESHRKAQSGREIATDPAIAQIARLRTRSLTPAHSRITDRDGLKVPAFGKLLNHLHPFRRCQLLP